MPIYIILVVVFLCAPFYFYAILILAMLNIFMCYTPPILALLTEGCSFNPGTNAPLYHMAIRNSWKMLENHGEVVEL